MIANLLDYAPMRERLRERGLSEEWLAQKFGRSLAELERILLGHSNFISVKGDCAMELLYPELSQDEVVELFEASACRDFIVKMKTSA